MRRRQTVVKAILLGAPGSGKGTQSVRLANMLGVPRVSSGDLFRDHQDRDTHLGQLARAYMEQGVLVPDEVTIKMMMSWIESATNGAGFLLDGFPRTLTQAKALDIALANQGSVDNVICIEVPEDELVHRLSSRLVCADCQLPSHSDDPQTGQHRTCSVCGGDLYQRKDDEPIAIKKRLQVYLEQTTPLLEYYRGAGKLKEVDGHGSVEDVGKRLEEVIR